MLVAIAVCECEGCCSMSLTLILGEEQGGDVHIPNECVFEVYSHICHVAVWSVGVTLPKCTNKDKK